MALSFQDLENGRYQTAPTPARWQTCMNSVRRDNGGEIRIKRICARHCSATSNHCERSARASDHRIGRPKTEPAGSALSRCLRNECCRHVLNLLASAFGAARVSRLMFCKMLDALERFTTLFAAVLVGRHGNPPVSTMRLRISMAHGAGNSMKSPD